MKRFTIRAAAFLAALAVFAGCSGSSGDISEKNDDTEQETSAQTTVSQSVSDDDSASGADFFHPAAQASTTYEEPVSVNSEEKNYTVMVYLVGSDLESVNRAASYDIAEMLTSNADSSKMNIIVYCGGTKTWHVNVPMNKNTYLEYRYTGTKGKFDIADTTEPLSMGSADTFADFLNYTYEHYPAKNYGLICWDHGGGPILGYGSDELYDNPDIYVDTDDGRLTIPDSLLLTEMKDAFENSPFRGDNKLSFIGFDACLMGSIEIADTLKDYADYMIASEETEPGTGWNYAFLPLLGETDDMNKIGKRIVDDYMSDIRKYKSYSFNPEVTLSCLDLSKTDGVINAIDVLFSKMNTDYENGDMMSSMMGRYYVRGFGFSGGSDDSGTDIIDLGDFAEQMKEVYPEECAGISEAISDMVVYKDGNIKEANGVSIYYPFYNPVYFVYLGGNNYIADSPLSKGYSDYMRSLTAEWGGIPSRAYDNIHVDAATNIADLSKTKEDIVQLTPEQLKDFSYAYYTIINLHDDYKFDLDEEKYVSYVACKVKTERLPLVPDSEGNLHIDLDPYLLYVQSESGSILLDAVYDGRSGGETIYVPDRTSLLMGDGDLFGSEQLRVNFRLRTNSGSDEMTVLCADSSTDEESPIKVVGKGSVDVDDYASFAVGLGYFEDKDIDPNKPYYDWGVDMSYKWIGLETIDISDSFSFGRMKLSEAAKTYNERFGYQLIVVDKGGTEHAYTLKEIDTGNVLPERKVITTEKGTMDCVIYNDHAEIVRYLGEDTSVTIPDNVEGKPVTVIGSRAFYSCDLESIIIPDTVTTIDYSAFGHCSLSSIKLPENLDTIGNGAFQGLKNLKEIIIPEKLKKIGRSAFSGSSLKKVYIPASVEYIGYGAFSYCDYLDTVEISPDNRVYKTVDNVIFSKDGKVLVECTGVSRSEYTVPDGVEEIGAAAFDGCYEAYYAEDPDSWDYVERGLTKVNFPETLKRIGHFAFTDCMLLSADLPDSLEFIGCSAFSAGFTSETWRDTIAVKIHIGPNVSQIRKHAFGNYTYDDITFEVDEDNAFYAVHDGKLTNLNGSTEVEWQNWDYSVNVQ